VKALWLEERALRFREDLKPPELLPGEATVRVLLAGICNTDLELVKGYYPFTGVQGHEFVGRVEACASAPDWVGRRVVGEINASCGACETCRAGRPTHCERRTVLGLRGRDGAFAERLRLPAANLHLVPDGVSDEAACFTEPLAAALQIQQQVPVHPEDHVVVIGAGKLGQLVARTLGLRARDVLVVGRDRSRLRPLADLGLRVGTAETIDEGRADLVVECTGNPDGLALASRAVRPQGTVVLKSTCKEAATLDVSRLVVNEVTLVGSRCGAFAPALELLSEGRVEVAPLVEARFPLREGLRAFEEAARPGVLKVLLDCT
jgi:threonine dehydrogenase-like Zn-dependent dehydrogenase